MITVDRALIDVLQYSGIECEIDFFCLEKSFTLDLGYVEIDYNLLDGADQLATFDRILFWGDFLHWKNYVLRDVAPRMVRSGAADCSAAVVDAWYQRLMLEGREDLQRKSIVFGSTIYALTATDLADGRYVAALSSLYANARLVRLRDVMSAGFAAQLVGDGRDYLGCDCAFFLKRREITVGDRPAPSGEVVVAFGRSGSTMLYRGFTERIAEMAGRRTLDLGWLDRTAPLEIDHRIDVVRNAAFVVTDIYHVAVTAMREGTPLLCFARGTAATDSTLSDKKKEILMSQHFARRNLVHQEIIHLTSSSDKTAKALVDQCLETIRDQNHQRAISTGLRRHVDRQVKSLHAAIFG
ncbi:polysaccharide pyruvyl transferase family protein [Aquibium sp. ELW1220]|uniref:polysaccharide pyruvyl transferase family protein n=1 Tax=Aquibium sp. ELW1220 TaxID=2976766 RepID=UPI0025B09E3A|nr:polysaccharide pyruvyl transferase family protein [Aquibium sp. ELW1220]MDN2578990.1 polysaccharide pyruvyl transferase family protein [Aquibium sp. ELW1220]